MHELSTSFVLGYHGCDQKIAEKLLGGEPFRTRDNDYDWLGPGIYFWEANPKRGLNFAKEVQHRRKGRSSIKTPAVIGAVLDLGRCLDLLTQVSIEMVQGAYESLLATIEASGAEMPQNHSDLLRRNLDCAVIRRLHQIRQAADLPPIDSIRGIFVEGPPLYDQSGFQTKTHVQIAICNPACIKGVFRVREEDLA